MSNTIFTVLYYNILQIKTKTSINLLCECYISCNSTEYVLVTIRLLKGMGIQENRQPHHHLNYYAGTDGAYPGGAVDGSPGPPGVGIFRSALLSCSAALFAAWPPREAMAC